jgi:hypothetical protein
MLSVSWCSWPYSTTNHLDARQGAEVDFKSHIFNAVHDNFEVIDSCDNWSQLEFLEAYYIKNYDSTINDGLKASKELQLFYV